MHSGVAGTLVRWLLPAFVALALLGMHHLPAADGDYAAVPAPHEVLPPAVAESGLPASADAVRCCAPPATPAQGSPGDHGAGHELLHLCLAVLTALAGLVLALFVIARGMAGHAPAAVVPAAPIAWARPPPPLARRLAALGVLRL